MTESEIHKAVAKASADQLADTLTSRLFGLTMTVVAVGANGYHMAVFGDPDTGEVHASLKFRADDVSGLRRLSGMRVADVITCPVDCGWAVEFVFFGSSLTMTPGERNGDGRPDMVLTTRADVTVVGGDGTPFHWFVSPNSSGKVVPYE